MCMNKIQFSKGLFACVLVGICLVLSALAVGAEQEQRVEPGTIELTGRFHRPVKWTPQLKIVPAGQMQHIDLEGNLIRDIKEGTPLRVRGVVRSRLHRGGTTENPSPFPPQWIVWLEVSHVEILTDEADLLTGGGVSNARKGE